jgi:hypothetical protein
MEDYHWYFVIALILVSGVFLFVFIYTLNRTPDKDDTSNKILVKADINIDANTISFYSEDIDNITIYAVKENTTSQLNMIENFDVTEPNTIYDEPCDFVLSALAPGTYKVGYTSSKSSNNSIGVLTIKG